MTALGTYLHTLFSGSLVGTDDYGNRYYQQRKIPKEGKRKRWVLFKGEEEATKNSARMAFLDSLYGGRSAAQK